MLRVGAQLFTVREHTQTPEGFAESLGKIKDMGYKLVQVSGAGKDVPVEHIAKVLKETGLSCTVTHISFDDLLTDFDAVVRKHDAWNCEYVGVGSMPMSYRSEEGIYRFAEDAGKVSEKLAKAGKKFVYHNHSFEFAKYGEKRGMDILFDNTPDTFQFELDMYWVQNAGADPIEWTRKVAGRMDIMHFKDMDIDLSVDEKKAIMAPIGGGNMNWPGIVKALNETGVKYGFVEQDICRKDPFDCLKDSLGYLKSIGVSV